MEENYEVYLENATVGRIQIEKRGLFYYIDCRCKVPQDKIYRVAAIGENCWDNLGIPIPEGTGFQLKRRIPIKSWNKNNNRFILLPFDKDIQEYLTGQKEQMGYDEPSIPNGEETGKACVNVEKFIPVEADMPFPEIQYLENASLEERDGIKGALIVLPEEENQISKDNPIGQWSEPSTSE